MIEPGINLYQSIEELLSYRAMFFRNTSVGGAIVRLDEGGMGRQDSRARETLGHRADT